MLFDEDEREFITRWLNDERRYSAPMIAHLFPGRGADPFPMKTRLLSKLMTPDILKRLPEPDGETRHFRSSAPAWFGHRWKQLMRDLETEEKGEKRRARVAKKAFGSGQNRDKEGLWQEDRSDDR